MDIVIRTVIVRNFLGAGAKNGTNRVDRAACHKIQKRAAQVLLLRVRARVLTRPTRMVTGLRSSTPQSVVTLPRRTGTTRGAISTAARSSIARLPRGARGEEMALAGISARRCRADRIRRTAGTVSAYGTDTRLANEVRSYSRTTGRSDFPEIAAPPMPMDGSGIPSSTRAPGRATSITWRVLWCGAITDRDRGWLEGAGM